MADFGLARGESDPEKRNDDLFMGTPEYAARSNFPIRERSGLERIYGRSGSSCIS